MDIDEISRLILAAVGNKYAGVTLQSIATIVDETVRLCVLLKTEEALLQDSFPTRDLKSDVRNQTRCYYLIEASWRHLNPTGAFLQKLHAAVVGLPSHGLVFRETDFVEDYGGEVPVPKEEISDQLSKLNRMLQNVGELASVPDHRQAAHLAMVFSSVIKVHPFRDGNGRTARMVAQFCLRRWGRPYMIIPKVRHDPAWKTALSLAIDSDLADLTASFLQRMRQAS